MVQLYLSIETGINQFGVHRQEIQRTVSSGGSFAAIYRPQADKLEPQTGAIELSFDLTNLRNISLWLQLHTAGN